MKRSIAGILAIWLALAGWAPAWAAGAPSEKEEVVYGILNLDGTADNIYVVNIFNGRYITDYGNYTEVKNLTTSEKLNQNGDEITVSSSADKLYYQGTLKSKELPWNIEIRYVLDGKEIPGEDLAGEKGALQIAISVRQNPTVNRSFFDNYALQVTLQLDTMLCDNIEAGNATIGDAGSKKQIAYTILPGQGADLCVTADVHNFEMDPVTINGIKLSLDIPIDKSEFSEQISQLTEALKELDDGSGKLLDGANQLAAGVEKYMDGLKTFKDGLEELADGADSLNSGAISLKNGLSELSRQNESLIYGAESIQQAAFDSVNSRLASTKLGLPVLTPQNYNLILADIPELAAVKTQLDDAVRFTQGLKSYTNGVARLGAGASDLANGTSQFKNSTLNLATAADELYNSSIELNSAIKELRDGLAVYKDGTGELRSSTSNIDDKISDQIDAVIAKINGAGGKTISFVSDKNTAVSSVQFVLKTDAIKTPKTETAAASQAARLSFWQKLLQLFGFSI